MKQKLAFSLIMVLITTGLVSFTLIAFNVGFGNRFVEVWLRSWLLAYVPALFSILFISPIVARFVNTLYQKKSIVKNEGLVE